jgi:hypothetical protein
MPLAARAGDQIAPLRDVGLGRRHVPGLTCGQIERGLLAFIEFDTRREAGPDRIDGLGGVLFLTQSERPSLGAFGLCAGSHSAVFEQTTRRSNPPLPP